MEENSNMKTFAGSLTGATIEAVSNGAPLSKLSSHESAPSPRLRTHSGVHGEPAVDGVLAGEWRELLTLPLLARESPQSAGRVRLLDFFSSWSPASSMMGSSLVCG